ncbi:MAG: hypothetical protein AAGD96_36430 [Chloroflexota bacterium]
MNLAILCSGPIPEHYYPVTGGGHESVFGRLFDQVPHAKLTFTEIDVSAGEYPNHPSDFDGYIVGGSSRSVYEDVPWINDLAQYYRELYAAGSKLVGICFGHQMLAQALGGEVSLSPNGWGIGVKSFEVYEHEAWMAPSLDRCEVLMSCQDQVQSLPPDSKILAGSDFCPVGLLKVGENMLGIQGHPEFLPSFSEALMDARTDRIPADTIKAARATLNQSTNTKELATWMINFLQS